MKILICGDRNWTDKQRIKEVLRKHLSHLSDPNEALIIHGAARGADSLGGKVAAELGCRVKTYPALWTRYGKGAGPIRNQHMLDCEHPDLCLAFHSNISESKGTADMLRRCRKAGVPSVLTT